MEEGRRKRSSFSRGGAVIIVVGSGVCRSFPTERAGSGLASTYSGWDTYSPRPGNRKPGSVE
jgi:hypothetical protein